MWGNLLVQMFLKHHNISFPFFICMNNGIISYMTPEKNKKKYYKRPTTFAKLINIKRFEEENLTEIKL